MPNHGSSRVPFTRAQALAVMLTALVGLAACQSSATSNTPRARPVSFCGQQLTKPTFTTQGMQMLVTHALPNSAAPVTSTLPAPISSNSTRLSSWSNLLILSSDCRSGFTVVVAASQYVRTVGIAYNADRTGIVALLLGRLKSAPRSLGSILVSAYRTPDLVGQVHLTF